MIEADHDLRNPADMLVLNKLAKGVLGVPGISRVQAITRPEGTPLVHTSIPFWLSMSQAFQLQNLPFQKDRMNDLLKQADMMSETINIMQRMYGLMQQLVATTHDMVGKTHEMQEITNDLRDHISDFEDFFRPVRSYFYWERHCYDIPICWSLRSVFDSLDGVDAITDKLQEVVKDLDQMDVILPQILAQFPEMIAIMQSMRTMMLTMHSTMSGVIDQMDANSENATAMGKAFDTSKNDDSFYLPPDVFNNRDFKRLLKVFLSPDGKAARMLITLRDNPSSPQGVKRVDANKNCGRGGAQGDSARKRQNLPRRHRSDCERPGGRLQIRSYDRGSRCALPYFHHHADHDAKFCCRPGYRRHGIAFAGRVVRAVRAGLAGSFGIQIHWVVLAMSVIVLLAVGSDYNLLLVSRMKEEIGAGLKTASSVRWAVPARS